MSSLAATIPDWCGPDDPLAGDRLRDLAAKLSEADGQADEAGVFPEHLWRMVQDAGATRWALPERFPDSGGDRAALVVRYARVAEGSLTAAFILTQHDAAVRRLAAAQPDGKTRADAWLDRIAAGEIFPTVGISQLTTSRRHGPQAMRAIAHPGAHFTLDGAMPWVTAAERADLFVTGGVLDDGRQLLIALPGDRPGVSVEPAFELAALGASRTCEVRCRNVRVEPGDVLAGPSPDVMNIPGLAGTGGLETSAVALGQARAALVALAEQAQTRDDLVEPVESLSDDWRDLAKSLLDAAVSDPEARAPGEIRADANALVLRLSQAYLTARKGSGFVRGEPAQRWARQALFFLVWSCPSPVANAAIREMAGLCPA